MTIFIVISKELKSVDRQQTYKCRESYGLFITPPPLPPEDELD